MREEVTKAVWLKASKPVTSAKKVHLGVQPECLLSLEFILIRLPTHLTSFSLLVCMEKQGR